MRECGDLSSPACHFTFKQPNADALLKMNWVDKLHETFVDMKVFSGFAL